MAITDSIKHAPRWAWYTAAGVGVGAAGLKLWKGRASDAPTQEATDADPTGNGVAAANGSVLTGSPTAVVVPSIVTGGDSGDNGALTDMMSLWIGAVHDTVDQLGQVYAPIAQTEAGLLASLPDMWQHQNDTLLSIIQSGSAPAPASQAPTPIQVTVQAAPTPVQAAPAAPAAPAVVNRTYTKSNGLSGTARKVWCMCGDHKVADGACWGEGYPCT